MALDCDRVLCSVVSEVLQAVILPAFDERQEHVSTRSQGNGESRRRYLRRTDDGKLSLLLVESVIVLAAARGSPA